MNKKIPLIVVFIIVVAWFIFRAVHAPVPKNEVVIDSDTSVKPLQNVPLTLKVNDSKSNSETHPQPGFGAQKVRVHETHDSQDERFEEFDRQEKVWLTSVKKIIGEKDYPTYVQMREQSEKEKMMAYKEYHDYLRQKYGDKFSYNISEDQSIREKDITKRYLAELLKIIGADKFTKYTAARDQFNENMRRQNKESIQIEF
jgi:uncharacterized short protein YbdD (DUF466 family)